MTRSRWQDIIAGCGVLAIIAVVFILLCSTTLILALLGPGIVAVVWFTLVGIGMYHAAGHKP